jgi:hypothetical protein
MEKDVSGPCPKDSDLVRLSKYETDQDESERLFRHLARCSRCSVRFAVLKQLDKDLRPKIEAFAREFDAEEAGPLLASAARKKLQAHESTVTTARPRPKPSGLTLNPRLAAAFLVFLAVVATGIYLTATKSDMYSSLRSASDSPTLFEPTGRISAPPTVFRWSPVARAESYVFDLYDESLERVHACSTYLINELVLGADIRAKLTEGKTYLWTVSARDGDSALLATRSGTFVIE